MRSAVLYSGGKDSTYSAYLARQKEKLTCLVTIVPSREDSWMFHHPNVRWTRLQAEAMGLPQILVESEGVKEVELDDLRRALVLAKEKYEIESVYSGALASRYQKSRVERICSGLSLQSVSPLWNQDSESYLRRLVREGFRAIITGVSALGLDEHWLGRELDGRAIDDLLTLHAKYGIHPGLEGGEGETYVLDCPMFGRRIEIESSKNQWSGDSGFLTITEARLVQK